MVFHEYGRYAFWILFPLKCLFPLSSISLILITVIFILMFLKKCLQGFFFKWFVLIWMCQDHGNIISKTQCLQCFQTQSRYWNIITGVPVSFHFFLPVWCHSIYFLLMCFSLYTGLYFWYTHSYGEPGALWTCLVSQYSWYDWWIILVCSVTENVWWKSWVLFLHWQ